jgi:N utilization substance protein B
MKVSRKKTRRHLVQQLYARIFNHFDEIAFNEAFFDDRFDFEPDRAYMKEMFDLIVLKQQNILDIISQYAPKFDLDTMQKTNTLALAIAITEMLWITEEIPAKVSINEAIDLSKYFGDDTSKNIVNGILNSFYNNIDFHLEKDIESKTKLQLFCD